MVGTCLWPVIASGRAWEARWGGDALRRRLQSLHNILLCGVTGLRGGFPAHREVRPVAASFFGRPAGTKLLKLKDCRYKECGGFVLLSTGMGRPQVGLIGRGFEVMCAGNVLSA